MSSFTMWRPSEEDLERAENSARYLADLRRQLDRATTEAEKDRFRALIETEERLRPPRTT